MESRLFVKFMKPEEVPLKLPGQQTSIGFHCCFQEIIAREYGGENDSKVIYNKVFEIEFLFSY